MPETRRYSLKSYHRADDFAGEINVTTIETVTEIAGGVRVTSHARGIHEGTEIDQRAKPIDWPGVTLGAAHGYRIRHGYTYLGSNVDPAGEPTPDPAGGVQ